MGKWLLFAAIGVWPWLASAQSGIDGVWKTDPHTVTGANKPSRYVVDADQYRCESCAPKIKEPADGQAHALPGNPYIQARTARVIDEHTFEVTSVAGHVVSIGKMTVSADARSMVRDVTVREANGTTSSTTETLSRVGAVPRRGHPVSGTWKFAKLVKITDETLTFKSAAVTLSMNASDGTSYDAPMDGTKVPVRNSPGVDTVAVTARAGTTWEETSYAGDRPVWVNTFSVTTDGTRMKVAWEDKL